MLQPNLVVAADWSTGREKRWMARASWSGEGYLLSNPFPVGECATLLHRLQQLGGRGGTVLAGFDFPIGLPAAYARAQFPGEDFRTILKTLPEDFFCPSDNPTPAQPFGPSSSASGAPGPDSIAEILLGIKDKRAILRACDRRANAHPIFHTLGARQVGRAAAQGWKEVLQPSLETVRLWPFDGSLDCLLKKSGIVVAEIYPALFYRRLPAVVSSLKGKGKETVAARSTMFWELLRTARADGTKVTLTDAAQEWVEAGFASSDDFDAMSGVVGMLQTLAKGDRMEPPAKEEAVREVEGWMLGLERVPISVLPA